MAVLARLAAAILIRAIVLFAAYAIYIVAAITAGHHLPLLAIVLLAAAIAMELFALPPLTRGLLRRLRVPETGVRWIDRG